MESTPGPFADTLRLRTSLGIDDSVLADVRLAGDRLGPRVPELVESFYEWLAPFPEFAQFFSGDDVLLARVKSQQTAYWRDFLRAQIDAAYVERRRVVGLVHARIELGLLIYLRAMEFVATWLVQQVEKDEVLARKSEVSFSIRKLIHFDSAIVVQTYATRTAQMLEEQRMRLGRVAGVMEAVTGGDLTQQLEMKGTADVLGSSVNEMVRSLRGVARAMRDIARGDYSGEVAPRGDRDELGVALQAMTRALRDSAAANDRHLWMITSLAELADAMSGNPTIELLSREVIAYLCRVLGAQVGALYVAESRESLRLAGTYAVAEDSGVPRRWKLGEGLVGQAAAEQRRILVHELPEDSIRVRWGLGEALPRSLVVVPLIHEAGVRGVVEIGTLSSFSERQLELLERGAASVALALSAAETRARVQQLLEESQAQAEELTSQQHELRQVNEMLAEQTRALELQKESLEVTESVLRQKAAELEQASRYKSEFLANMSHELRTPLNSTLILAKLLHDNSEGNLTARQVEYAKSIYSAGNDLLALIDDILDLSKIEAGKIDLSVETVRVERLVADLADRFEPLVAGKNIELSFAIDPSCPEAIETDSQRLRQVLTNLLSNAVKFTERGYIRLAAAPSGVQQVAFSVEDTGIGIPVERQQVIFEAFRQADGTTNRRFGGTGLGLSICRELATLLGGEIKLRSTPGEGSVFTLLMPLRLEHPKSERSPEPSRAPAPQPVPAQTESPTLPAVDRPFIDDDRDRISDPRRVILLVEDDAAFARILRDLARELRFQCVIASSADEALRFVYRYRPAAVVLDVVLPDGSGLAVLAALKRDPATRHIPIHVVSVHDHSQRAREMGAVGYALKPVERDHLISAFRLLEARLSRRVKSVLVVEDDAVQRDATKQLLSGDGVRVVTAATASEALTALRATTFDCVVLDLKLPDASGVELLDRMAEDEQCSFPPVIVYTAQMLGPGDEQRLRRHSESIIIKSARSPERLLEEVTLFLHQVETELPPDKQRMLKVARDRESVFDGRRILLVEDDVRNIFALTSMLEPKGVVIDVARNGGEALARLSEGPAVDLVLMDIMMPEMDGLTATREIRKKDGINWAALPIIALTAKAMPDDREQCLAAGASDYIAKPIDPDRLLSLLRVWMPA